MTIDELLETYRDVFAMTELEKGERFERLMKNFLVTYPVWRGPSLKFGGGKIFRSATNSAAKTSALTSSPKPVTARDD